MSLVEVLIAILLLGVILSAAASSIIQMTRAAVDNERRVQATALLTSLHEELQALPWDSLAIYEGDLDALTDAAAFGLVESDGVWLFDGDEVATIPGPGLGGRRSTVPELVTELTEFQNEDDEVDHDSFDRRDYRVVRLVTWSDRDAGIKRITTIVSWQLYNRSYDERFFSERAATAAELGDPRLPRVVQFDVGPTPMELAAVAGDPLKPAQNTRDLSIVLRLSQPVDSAVVRYRAVNVVDDGTTLVLSSAVREVALQPYLRDPSTDRPIAFRWTIPADSETFTNGEKAFEVLVTDQADSFVEITYAKFEGGAYNPDDVGEPSAPVEEPPSEEGGGGGEETGGEDDYPVLGPVAIRSLTVEPTLACQDADDEFVDEVVVTARIDGLLVEDADVILRYETGTGTTSIPMEAVLTDEFSTSNAEFEFVFPARADHGFRLIGQNENQQVASTSLRVVAKRTTIQPSTDQVIDGPVLEIRRDGGNICRNR